MGTRSRPGFTLLEAVVLIAVIVILVVVLLPRRQTTLAQALRVRSAQNLRNIHLGLVTFAADHDGDYPIPSLLDRQDQTEPTTKGNSHEKNRTGAIFSIMLFQSIVSPEMLVDPVEANPNIRAATAAEVLTQAPPGAVNPERAVWDPAFKGTPSVLDRANRFDPTNRMPDDVGFVSYAHTPLWGARFDWWNADANLSRIPVLGNRGPKFEGDDGVMPEGGWKLVDGPQGTQSYTLAIHGKKDRWEGNIAYNDGSVKYEQSPAPEQLMIDVEGITARDNIFCDEPTMTCGYVDMIRRQNAYLRLYRVGPPNLGAFDDTSITSTDAPWWDGLD